jgi:hypothetical protein
LAPITLPPLSPVSNLSFFLSLLAFRWSSLLGGMGWGPESYEREKA